MQQEREVRNAQEYFKGLCESFQEESGRIVVSSHDRTSFKRHTIQIYLEEMRPIALRIYKQALKYQSRIPEEAQRVIQDSYFGILELMCRMVLEGVPGKTFSLE